MKKAGKLILWVAGAYLGLMLLSGLAIKAMLSSARIQAVLGSVSARLPVTVSAQEGSFDLAQWFRFRPAIALKQVSIANPPGFSSQPMLQVAEVGAQVALLSLFGKEFEILGVELGSPELRIESNAKGVTNVAMLLSAPSSGGGSAGRALSIDSFSVSSGAVRYADFAIQDIQLSLSDFSAGKSCRMTLGARLFGGKTSRLDFNGRAGPASADTLPAQGTLAVVLAAAEIPAGLRQQYLGDLVGAPSSASKVSFTTAMQGDLMKSLSGDGELVWTDFHLGASNLNLAGKAPLHITLQRVLTNPGFEVASRNASLQHGQGAWKGALEASYDGARLQGESSGSIHGVEIAEMMKAFTTAKESVSGLAEIPQYHIRFAGKDAAQIQRSLAGDGEIRLQKGRVSMFDLLGTIEAKMKSVLGGESAAAGATQFLTFTSHFQIKDGQVMLPDMVMQAPSSTVNGQGYFDFNHALSFDLATNVTGALASRLGGTPDSSLRVPVKIRGTLESPKVTPDIGGMAKQQAIEKATGLVQSLFNKRK